MSDSPGLRMLDRLRGCLRKVPFEPFEVRLRDGTIRQVRDTGQVALGENIAFLSPSNGTSFETLAEESIIAVTPIPIAESIDKGKKVTREQIHEFLDQEPFEPFQIRLSNGEVHQIRHPENAMLLRTVLIVGYPEQDRAVRCTLHHNNSAEEIRPLQSDAT